MDISIKKLDRICLVTLIVVCLAGGYRTVSHVLKTKERFRIEKNLLSQRMKEINLAATSLGELKNALKDTKKALRDLNERVPESGNIGIFLNQIDDLMKKRNLSLTSVLPAATREEKIYIRIPIELSFRGGFVDIYRFLGDLENLNRIVLLDEIDIQKEIHTDTCQADLLISVFERG